MSKILTKVGIGGMILLLVGYFYVSPFIVVYQLQTAIEQNNADKLSAYIDFESVKDSLREPLVTFLNKEYIQAKQQAKPSTADIQRQIFHRQTVNKLLDQLLSPAGVKAILQEHNTELGRIKSVDDFMMGYRSVNRFAVLLKIKEKENARALVTMHREGLTWSVKAIAFIRAD